MGGKRRPSWAHIDLEIAIELLPGKWLGGWTWRGMPAYVAFDLAIWMSSAMGAEVALETAKEATGSYYPDAKFHWRVR